MKRHLSVPVVLPLVLLLLVSSSMSTSIEGKEEGEGEEEGELEMSADGKTVVHIVHVDRPEGEEPEAFHIRTLASVVGSEEAAKEALVYHYTHAASGFSAKLTPQQASDLSQKPEVLGVTPSRIYHLD